MFVFYLDREMMTMMEKVVLQRQRNGKLLLNHMILEEKSITQRKLHFSTLVSVP